MTPERLALIEANDRQCQGSWSQAPIPELIARIRELEEQLQKKEVKHLDGDIARDAQFRQLCGLCRRLADELEHLCRLRGLTRNKGLIAEARKLVGGGE